MGQLLQDMSRLRPAPTVKRETAVALVSLVLVIPFLAAVFLFLEDNRALNMTLGGALLLWVLGRWAVALARGDVRTNAPTYR
jgi:uncharacterized membrane protein (GlpM family)